MTIEADPATPASGPPNLRCYDRWFGQSLKVGKDEVSIQQMQKFKPSSYKLDRDRWMLS
jgi:hypothetical protein